MLEVASKSPLVLGDALELIQSFLERESHPQGGVKNRAGEPDLYYGFFGLESKRALAVPWEVEPWVKYLESFGDGPSDDLVHLSCLIRCWANLPSEFLSEERRDVFRMKLERFKSKDGAFNTTLNQDQGSAYGCFVALDTFDNLKASRPDPEPLIERIIKVKTPTGGFAFNEGMVEGTTPTTAAAIVGLAQLGYSMNELASSREWLLSRRHESGGLLAVPNAPMPDLLSTATALHTLNVMGEDISSWSEHCLDYVDSLWVNTGGFYAHWSDETLDVEYLYYALLALGHLASK